MWIAKDKTACDVPSFIEFPSGSSVCLFDYEGSFAIGFASGTQVEQSNALYIQVMFRGTEAECEEYITDLVERLNAPAIITQGLTAQITREINRIDGDLQFAHNKIYELQQITRELGPKK